MFESRRRYAEDEGDTQLANKIEVIEKWGARLPDFLAQIEASRVESWKEADLGLITAHKAKGLEFAYVMLGSDFKLPMDSFRASNLSTNIGFFGFPVRRVFWRQKFVTFDFVPSARRVSGPWGPGRSTHQTPLVSGGEKKRKGRAPKSRRFFLGVHSAPKRQHIKTKNGQ